MLHNTDFISHPMVSTKRCVRRAGILIPFHILLRVLLLRGYERNTSIPKILFSLIFREFFSAPRRSEVTDPPNGYCGYFLGNEKAEA